MKIYLVSSKKINIYVLPDKVEDAFLINYYEDNIEETITLQAENGKWIINSNSEVTLLDNYVQVYKITLTNDSCFHIKFNDIDNYYTIYCSELPITYSEFDISNIVDMKVGKTDDNNIVYNGKFVIDNHAYLDKKSGYWQINALNGSSVYVNNEAIVTKPLNIGDVIFIGGLRIIWMQTFIRINNPNLSVKTTLSPLQLFGSYTNKYTEVKETDKNNVLYNDNDIFFHTSRVKNKIKEKVIVIDRPPEPPKDEQAPILLTLGPSIVMGVSSSITGIIVIIALLSGKSTGIAIVGILICLLMIAGAVIFPYLLEKDRKRKLKLKELQRVTRYREYSNEKKQLIEKTLKEQHDILFTNNPSTEELKQAIVNHDSTIWSWEIKDDDFLTLRLGIGTKDANIRVECNLDDFSITDDFLRDEVATLSKINYKLNDVPITIQLTRNLILPIIILDEFQNREYFINNLVLQLVSKHYGGDLKIVVITNEDRLSRWESLKYLFHLTNAKLDEHYLASTPEDIKNVSYYLEEIYKARVKKREGHEEADETSNKKYNYYKNFDTYYLIITDDFINAKNSTIVSNILKSDINYGFSVLMLDSSMKNVPSVCSNIVEVRNENSNIYNKEREDNKFQIFRPEIFTEQLYYYLNILSNIPVQTESEKNTIAESISFLEMLRVGKIEHLNVLNRWEKNDPTLSLHTPIGVGDDGKLFELDLHEKFHGPHGLIAGSTGSGKSEWIITYILSMAVNYDPEEVQFVLIDYKGGGLAGAFENKETGVRLPHVVGILTNLDTAEMNRSLVSIRSELQRRQKIFNETRDTLNESTIDIYKYQMFYRAGKIKNPIAHLFIICDEFAELKQQQPDFMNELISTARIGRSLGVHLILATQKPSGVVDDQIWSNSKFKVCLKVQTAEDSIEMLKRPDAANLKHAGRFFLQIGYDEQFLLGQAAWAGAKYIPTDILSKHVNDEIKIIDNCGNIIEKINDNPRERSTINIGDQLTNLVKYISNIGKRENRNIKPLWLNSIPEDIYLSNIIKKYNYTASAYNITPIIGEYDDPSNQKQDKLIFDFMNNGNLLIVGMAGSGKDNLLMTLIYSICLYHSSNEVNFYILDCGAEILKLFRNMPQVGDVVLSNEKSKVKNLFLMILREFNRRKEIFSEYGGNYQSYIKSGNKCPVIFFVINSYENFYENYASFDDILNQLLRDAAKYGIIIIETAIQNSSLRSITLQLFQQKAMLQVVDPFDYRIVLDSPVGLIPKKCFGRGLVTTQGGVFEFQTAYIYLKDKINDTIITLEDQIKGYNKAPSIPMIPFDFQFDRILKYIDTLENIPVGINIRDASISRLNCLKNKTNLIIGNSMMDNVPFINDFIKTIAMVPNTRVKVLDFAELIHNSIDNVEVITTSFTDRINHILDDNNTKTKNIYVILGIGYIYDKVLDEGIVSFNKIMNDTKSLKNINFFIIDSTSSLKRVEDEEWFKSRNKDEGIWIGTGIKDQNVFNADKVLSCDAVEDFAGVSYLLSKDEYQVMKCIGTSHDDII